MVYGAFCDMQNGTVTSEMVFIYNICICIGKYEIEDRFNVFFFLMYYLTSCNSCGQENEKEDELNYTFLP
jgi:hypothetical protein